MSKLIDFVSNVKAGVAKPQYFTVQLKLPADLDGAFRQHMPKVILFCDQAQIPGLSFSTAQVRSYGEFKEVPYEKLFEQVNLSFYVDSDMIVRKLFDNWVGLIQNPVTREFNYPKYYISDTVDIIVSDVENQDRYKVTLHKVYPKAVSPIQLDYSAKDVMKLQVTLSYQYATSEALAKYTKEGDNPLTSLANEMPNYGYGFNPISAIPVDYFNDFSKFQETYRNADFSYGGVRNALSQENIGEITGFGNIFI